MKILNFLILFLLIIGLNFLYAGHFKIEYEKGKGFIAKDINNQILFTIYQIDNGPDYPSEGLFRIIDNGKIGFADVNGNIIIKPQFSFALPFHYGLAGFCKGCKFKKNGEYTEIVNGKWGFIDKKGKIVIPPKFDKIYKSFDKGIAMVENDGEKFYININGKRILEEQYNCYKLTDLFGEALIWLIKKRFPSIKTEISWNTHSRFFNFFSNSLPFLKIKIFNKEKIIGIYNFIPWQDFEESHLIDFTEFPEFFGVTGYAIFYGIITNSKVDDKELNMKKDFQNILIKFFNINNYQILNSKKLNFEGCNIISLKEYPYYFSIEMSSYPSPDIQKVKEIIKRTNKMLHLHIVPEKGEVKTLWLSPF